ncbi:hypothetical protein [Desulfuromonas acetoxidans]|uniref:DUF2802 domain-containing protein n=1 Tax=Desulfuromonas acetoxidans (strain DSM 684 / 11070) TaxID=281689 RepID=Q1JZR6_DESA6|nr:hypothetical protein [Desulfuromonas acetoxidans]EAT15826.1 hypothetical protein Dace_2526 [Desulfuromonas acetoxidans DSM 684]MBF0644972.1 hypothetical protein [Desulfuromonas acetoxidans]NVD25629.1 hypothetical protein [Desulfuromonas acetoxidans]NVE17681.1 hypothetical protein [Desulfuromonas acetoxidans]
MQQTLHNIIDMLFNLPHLQLIFVSFMMLVFGLAVWRLQRRVHDETRRREEADRQLLNALQRLTRLEDQIEQGGSGKERNFERSLDHAELKNRLQTPPATSGNPPNKYRHVAALAEQGMDEKQIADVLHISIAEASQLISLSRIACSE